MELSDLSTSGLQKIVYRMCYIWGVHQGDRGAVVCTQEGAYFKWMVEPSYLLNNYKGMYDEPLLFIDGEEDIETVTIEFLWNLANSRGTIQDYP